ADRNSRRCRLDRIVATGGHETPADESNHRVRIDATQLADGVEKEDRWRTDNLVCPDRQDCLSSTELRSTNERNRAQQSGNNIKPLRFARRDDHECILLADEAHELGNDRFFFALASGSEDQDAATGDEGIERAPDFQRLFVRRVIELDVAGHLHRSGWRADLDEALSVAFVTHEHSIVRTKNAADNRP